MKKRRPYTFSFRAIRIMRILIISIRVHRFAGGSANRASTVGDIFIIPSNPLTVNLFLKKYQFWYFSIDNIPILVYNKDS